MSDRDAEIVRLPVAPAASIRVELDRIELIERRLATIEALLDVLVSRQSP